MSWQISLFETKAIKQEGKAFSSSFYNPVRQVWLNCFCPRQEVLQLWKPRY